MVFGAFSGGVERGGLRGLRVVFAGYGRCIWAGNGRAFVWYLQGTGGAWAGNAWYLRCGRPTGDERTDLCA